MDARSRPAYHRLAFMQRRGSADGLPADRRRQPLLRAEDCFTRYGDDQVKRFVGGCRRASGGTSCSATSARRWCRTRRSTRSPSRVRSTSGSRSWPRVGSANLRHDRLLALRRARAAARPTTRTATRGWRSWTSRVSSGPVLFPTLAVGIEGLNPQDVPMTYKVFHAFNQWLDEDWGFAYKDRLYRRPGDPRARPGPRDRGARVRARARRAADRAAPGSGQRSLTGRSGVGPVLGARRRRPTSPPRTTPTAAPTQYADAFRLLWQRNGISDRVYEANLQQAVGRRPPDARHGPRARPRQRLRSIPAAADR